MNFLLIVPIPNVSNTGQILKPTEILISGDAKDQFNYSFQIYAKRYNDSYSFEQDITDLYTTLVGTDPDVDSRFTEPIESHLEMLFNKTY